MRKTVVLLAMLLVAGPASGALVLVENGLSRAPIVVFENAPPSTRRATEEPAEYLEKISGARPAVPEGRPDPLPERAIRVGFQRLLADGFHQALQVPWLVPEKAGRVLQKPLFTQNGLPGYTLVGHRYFLVLN